LEAKAIVDVSAKKLVELPPNIRQFFWAFSVWLSHVMFQRVGRVLVDVLLGLS
jgi:hypothetical protein